MTGGKQPPAESSVNETGVHPVKESRSIADRSTELGEVLSRLTGLADIGEANSATLREIQRENSRIGTKLDELRGDNQNLKERNDKLHRLNGEIFEELQKYRYKLERRMEDLERRVWDVERRVDRLEGKNGEDDDGPPDPAPPAGKR